MSRNEPTRPPDLRVEVHRAAQIPDLATRMLEIVAVIEAAAAPIGIHPVVVGGMAVYFWTASDAFLTHDIDVVMEVPQQFEAVLADLGFRRTTDGRHWQLEGTDVFLEAPSAHLDEDATVVDISLASGRTTKVLSRADILLDRLAELQATGHHLVAQQVLVLLANLTDEETTDLERRASDRRVVRMLQSVRKLADDISSGRELPSTDEIHELARAALRAEYSPESR
jgi:hypothetical protein